jgi:hypothetical protein
MILGRILIGGVACALLASAWVQAGPLVFTDDFNRPDGLLGSPWVTLESPLSIRSQSAVADSNEYGLMMFSDPGGCHCDDASLEITLDFQGDAGGRYQIFLIGSAPLSYSGFIGKLALDRLSIYGLPEVEIAAKGVALSPTRSYRLRLAYTRATSTADLVLTETDGTPVEAISVTALSGPLTACAVGVENLDETDHLKWLDDVRFDYCCEATSVSGELSSGSWGRVKSDYRR